MAQHIPSGLISFDMEDSAVRIMEVLISHAFRSRASDIHLEPQKSSLGVRMRVDGFLRETHRIPLRLHPEVISRIKVLSGLRTDDHFNAHDGRFETYVGESKIDMRVSIVPTYYGENCVMRLLCDAMQDFTLTRLGCTHAQREQIAAALRYPHGMILVTGPTGSGKTTTLYAMIKMLNNSDISIVSIEDPIEYAISGITQIPIGHVHLSFASGLRAVVRQDPDVIMVGEIRDNETASLSTNAALTGHLVLSTLHTNDAVSALPRLYEMGVEPYLISSTMRLVIGQRLVRRVCLKCKHPHKVTRPEKTALEPHVPEDVLRVCSTQYKGRGCAECAGSGFRGRVALMQVLAIDDALREAIIAGHSIDVIRKSAYAKGMISLVHDGCVKVQEGLTTLDEVMRMYYE